MSIFTPTQIVTDWLVSLGWDTGYETGVPIFPGPEIKAEPDRVVFLTQSDGPGYVLEGDADSYIMQARVRGPADDPIAAETLARNLDRLIYNAAFPVIIDGITIIHAHRVGSGPSPLPVDPSDLRHEFTCNYVITTGVV